MHTSQCQRPTKINVCWRCVYAPCATPHPFKERKSGGGEQPRCAIKSLTFKIWIKLQKVNLVWPQASGAAVPSSSLQSQAPFQATLVATCLLAHSACQINAPQMCITPSPHSSPPPPSLPLGTVSKLVHLASHLARIYAVRIFLVRCTLLAKRCKRLPCEILFGKSEL